MPVSLAQELRRKKRDGERIAMVSLYDAPTAGLCCDAGADILLVGDSLGNVILGYDNTVPVGLEAMEHHAGAVVRGARHSSRPETPIVVDLPLGTYQGSADTVINNGVRLLQTGAGCLKLEGAGKRSLRAVRLLSEIGAPVIGHIGYTPQAALTLPSVVHTGTAAQAARLLDQARRLEDAGCCAIVLEVVRLEVAARITRELSIPTIGIGAGPDCDGQVLIWHDLAGLTPAAPYRFVKRFAETYPHLRQAASDYIGQVRRGEFPTREHGWAMPAAEVDACGDGTPSAG